MIESFIRISGPGGGIDFESELIITALKKARCNVTVESNGQPRDNMSEFMKYRIGMIDDGNVHNIKVIIDHQPWGG